MARAMTDTEVERALGYTPCVCGVLNGTWHSECYVGKSKPQIRAGYKQAFAKARLHLPALIQAKSGTRRGGDPECNQSGG